MDTSIDDPSKRVPKSLNTDPTLVGSYTLADAGLALAPGVVVILLTQVLLPSSLRVGGVPVQAASLPLAGAAILVGAGFVAVAPSHTSSVDWLQTILRFYAGDRNHDHASAKSYTQVERLHPDHDAIERTDGALVGLVQIDPPNMALATEEEWAEKADAFEEFLNTIVEFPIQLYSTTRSFPVEEYLAHYEARLEDPDVKANPQLQRLIEQYIDWYKQDLERRQMTIRDHYVVVTVTPSEVQFDRESLAWQLADYPLIGTLIRVWRAPPKAIQRQALFETLDQRRHRIEGGLREIDGCVASHVPIDEAVDVIGRFWAGQDLDYDSTDAVLRTRPISRGETHE